MTNPVPLAPQAQLEVLKAQIEELAAREREHLADAYKLPYNHRLADIKSAKLDAYAEVQKLLAALPGDRGAQESVIDRIIQDVAELPDRTSPDDWPDAMLVTAAELRSILREQLQAGDRGAWHLSIDPQRWICPHDDDHCFKAHFVVPAPPVGTDPPRSKS